MKIVPVSIALGAGIYACCPFFWACNPGKPWWRKRDLVTDLCYWFIIPLFARYLRIGLLVMGAAFLFGIKTPQGLVAFYDNGHGPLAQLPLWLQAAIFLVGSDVMMYWIHRGFHRPALWRYHAVHHSSERPRLDFGGALPSRQYISRQRGYRRGPAARRHLAECSGVPRPVHDCAFRLRACQSELDARPVQICPRRPGIPSLASHRRGSRRGTRILHRPFRSST